jgi:hypothetical protein
VHDLVLAKLVRNSPVDLEDAKFLARTGRLNETVLPQRYEKELRPYLANEKRHDLTLRLWLEACFSFLSVPVQLRGENEGREEIIGDPSATWQLPK